MTENQQPVRLLLCLEDFSSTEISPSIEERFQNIINQIKSKRELWRGKGEERKWEEIYYLQKKWEEIDNESKELQWTIEAIGFVAAYFEEFIRKKTQNEKFTLRDNQLLYILLLLLNKGQYDFGRLETVNRGVQLPTGEGKTFGFGLTALIMALKGEKVHIIEPNYISAMAHFEQIAEFFSQFLGVSIGLRIDRYEKKGFVQKTRVRSDGVIESLVEKTGGRESYRYDTEGNKTIQLSGATGAERVWQCPVVYTTLPAVGFDYLETQLIGVRPPFNLPDFKKITALVAEADALMKDEATTPLVISSPKNWGDIFNFLGLSEFTIISSQQEKNKLAQILFFTIAYVLIEAQKQQKFFKEGEDFFFASSYVQITTSGWNKLYSLFSNYLKLYADYFDGEKKAEEWLSNYQDFLYNALYIFLLRQHPYRDISLLSEKPVLLDVKGLPMEKKQFESILHIFLTIFSFWDNWWQEARNKLERKKTTPLTDQEILEEMITMFADKIEISFITERLMPPSIFLQYGCLRFSSGSLTPSADFFKAFYQAEIFAVPRHQPIEVKISKTNENSFFVCCLDGGVAEVFFFLEDEDKKKSLVERVQKIIEQQRAVLIVVSKINEAEELEKVFKDSFSEATIVVVTAREELIEKGILEEQTKDVKPRTIIIATWIAHRDVDIRVSQEVKKEGGPEVIVYKGIPPNQETLWQVLQRTQRGDVPGERTLFLSFEDFCSSFPNPLSDKERSTWHNLWTQKQWPKIFSQFLANLAQHQEKINRFLILYTIMEYNRNAWKDHLIRLVLRSNYWQNRFGLRVIDDSLQNEFLRQVWIDFLTILEGEFLAFCYRNPPAQILTDRKQWRNFEARWNLHVSEKILPYLEIDEEGYLTIEKKVI